MAQLDLFGPRPTARDLYADAERPPAPLNSTVLPQDVPRLSEAQRRLLEAMRGGEWHTATELEAIGGRRFAGRMHELKAAGYPYECERVAGGAWRYRLIASPTNGIGGGV